MCGSSLGKGKARKKSWKMDGTVFFRAKSPAAPIVDKKDLTGAADSQVSTGPAPEACVENKVDELAAEMHAEEPRANEPKAQPPQAQWPEPQADELKTEEPQVEKATVLEEKVCAGAQTHEQIQVEVPKAEADELEEPKADIAKEQFEIKVTGADGPEAVCACDFWSP